LKSGDGNNCKTLIEAQIEGVWGVEMHFVPQLLACYYKKATSILHTYASKSNDHNEQVNIFYIAQNSIPKDKRGYDDVGCSSLTKIHLGFFVFFGQVFQGAYHAL